MPWSLSAVSISKGNVAKSEVLTGRVHYDGRIVQLNGPPRKMILRSARALEQFLKCRDRYDL
jgi:hypothetical protein